MLAYQLLLGVLCVCVAGNHTKYLTDFAAKKRQACRASYAHRPNKFLGLQVSEQVQALVGRSRKVSAQC